MASNSKPKVTIVDLLQQFLKQGVKPPDALLRAAADSEALQKPAIDPIQLGTGAYAFGPLAQLGGEMAGPVLNRLPLSELLGPVGKVPKLIEMAQKAVSGPKKGIPAVATEGLNGVKLPGGAVAAQGTGELPANNATTTQLEPSDAFSRKTEPLELDNHTMSLEPFDIDEMAGNETPATGDLLSAFAKNLNPKDTLPLPENTLYHGMNVFGHKTPKDALAKIAEQGMKGGWFSEEPHQAFGPHFLATTPEDLPPLLIRSKQFNVDPEKEIIPRWKKMNTENLHTQMQMRGKSPRLELSPDEVKGRPAVRSNWPNIHQLVGADEGGGGFPLEKGGHVVDPSKLFLSNNKGDILGRMAPKGGKPNAIGQLWDRVKAFRNVLEEGSGNKLNTIDSTFKKLFGDDPEFKGADKATKIKKLQQFVAQPEPENPALAKIWKPFMDEATAALEDAAGEAL